MHGHALYDHCGSLLGHLMQAYAAQFVSFAGHGPVMAPHSASPLRGREADCALLGRFVGQVQRGEAPVLAVIGAAGVGKSRLLKEAARIAESKDLNVLWLFGRVTRREEPFHSVRELLLTQFAEDLAEDETLMATSLGQLGLSEDETRALAALALGPRGRALWGFMPAGQQHLMVRAAVLRFFLALAGHQEVLLIVDDAHLLDTESRRCLHDLMNSKHADRPAVLMSMPSGLMPDLDGAAMAQHALEPLNAETLRQVFFDFCDAHPDFTPAPDLVGHLEALSLGAPLIVEELAMLSALHERSTEMAALPRASDDIFAARFGLLSTPARHVLQAMSLLGTPTHPALAQVLSGLDRDAVLAAIEELRERFFLSSDHPGGLTVRHERLAEACRNHIPGAALRMWHARLFDALRAHHDVPTGLVVLASHAEQAGRAEDALAYLGAACREWEGLAAPESLARMQSSVLTLLRPDTLAGGGAHIDAALGARFNFLRLGRLADLAEDLRAAATASEREGDMVRASDATSALAFASLLSGNNREALRVARQAQALAGPAGCAEASLVHAAALFVSGGVEAAALEASNLAQARTVAPEGVNQSARALWAWTLCEADRPEEALSKIDAPDRSSSSRSPVGMIDLLLAGISAHATSRAGDPDTGAAQLGSLAVAALRADCDVVAPLLMAWSADALLRSGRPACAIETCRDALEAPNSSNLAGHVAILLRCHLAEALLERGETNAAQYWSDEAARMARKCGDPLNYADAHRIRARLGRALGAADWQRQARLAVRLARRIGAARILAEAEALLSEA